MYIIYLNIISTTTGNFYTTAYLYQYVIDRYYVVKVHTIIAHMMYRYTDVWPYKVTSNLWTVFYFRSYTTLLCSRDLIFAIHNLVVSNIIWTFCLFWISFGCISPVILCYFIWWFYIISYGDLWWLFNFTVPSSPPPWQRVKMWFLGDSLFFVSFWIGVKVDTCCLLYLLICTT